MKHQSGFTLIELIMVIVILGILAATAMPKFANMQTEARLAVADGLVGSMTAAANIAHGIQLSQNLASDASVTLAGQAVTMVNGYPTADAAGIEAALDLTASKFDGWTAASGIQITGAGGDCGASYVAAIGGATVPPPTVTVMNTTC